MLAFLSERLSALGLPPLLHNYVATMAFVAIVYAAFFVVERLRPVEPIAWSSVWLNVRLSLVTQATILLAAVWLQPVLAGSAGNLFGSTGLIKTGSFAQQTLLFVGYLLVYDLLYYWLHRAQHRFDALWAIHKLHHTDSQVNVTTTLRVHWLEEVLKAVLIIFPVSLLFDAPPAAQGWLAGILGLWLFFIHLNMRISFGPLSWLLTSPAAHRIHHSLDHQQSNSNFAAIFPVWDILFGTFTWPRRDQWPRTGVAGEHAPGFWEANVSPFGAFAALAHKGRHAGTPS
jgi:sterol desaturase/sphingolipid hydroxylase (fatty acid hydroxylase superfamily)